jgi:glycosyltransferase involved in cell wall biosynthesis
MNIAVVGNYLPRKCGIATFTDNFVKSIDKPLDNSTHQSVLVVALNDPGQEYNYPAIVKKTIHQNVRNEYIEAAKFINDAGCDLCVIQHEFGIFGGESGAFILSLIENLTIPFIVIFHTVLKNPSYHEKAILKHLGLNAAKIVVMNQLAIDILVNIFDLPESKISVIHHGVPDFNNIKQVANMKPTLFPNRKLMCTFGLIGRSKGIETVIYALSEVVKNYPELLYIILGKTHPNVIKHQGEEYREFLVSLIKQLNLENNVILVDEFLYEEELKLYLLNVDIYITPYLNEAQITSGTLAYAVGAGRCIVSTPYWHAQDLLADGRGVFFDFGDRKGLTVILNDLLGHPDKIKEINAKTKSYGEKLYWPEIGRQYNQLFNTVILNPKKNNGGQTKNSIEQFPFRLDHLRRLTDSTGIFEHAKFCIPDYKEGYCLDDNARALLLCLMAYRKQKGIDVLDLIQIYLAYIYYSRKPEGFYQMRLSYARELSTVPLSEDAIGRTFWALGYLIRYAPSDSLFIIGREMFFSDFNKLYDLKSNRAIAASIAGLYHFIKRFPDNEEVLRLLKHQSNVLCEHFNDESNEEWKWFEPIISYDNALIPMALWYSFRVIPSDEVYRVAFESTIFLDSVVYRNGHISLVGNKSWYRKNEFKSSFSQQPTDAFSLIKMYYQAWKGTGDQIFFERMHCCMSWFYGNNDLFIPVYDEQTTGCNDGLEETGVNRNQGAESTISYLMAYLTIQAVDG